MGDMYGQDFLFCKRGLHCFSSVITEFVYDRASTLTYEGVGSAFHTVIVIRSGTTTNVPGTGWSQLLGWSSTSQSNNLLPGVTSSISVRPSRYNITT